MTRRLPVEPAPGPLEEYAARFDDVFRARAQRDGFRRYLEGLLLPAERNKTLTALANTEPVVGAQRKEAQSLQWFLTGRIPVNYTPGASDTGTKEDLDRLLALSKEVLPQLILRTVELLEEEDFAFDHGYVYRVEGGT